MRILGSVRRCLFGISLEEATFARRGFRPADASKQARLELIGQTFVQGYLDALAETDPDALAARLRVVEGEIQGFAFEGAAMGLALLDYVTPWPGRRWQALLHGPGADHTYMLHVGAGWAVARVPWARTNIESRLVRLDPLLGWLVVDGYGFHQGYFSWRQTIRDRKVPAHLSAYGRRVFDQGLGRSLWFVEGADVARLVETLSAFPASRRPDLYSGVGLACTYAGGVEYAAIETLKQAAGPCRPQLAQGAAFAAKARACAGNLGAHAEMACQILCGVSAQDAAAVTDECRLQVRDNDGQPAYEHWRTRIQKYLAQGVPSIG